MKISILTILILMANIQSVYTFSSVDFIDFPERWALLVGVGEYPATSSIEQLKSPADDVKAMRQMLTQYGGFPEQNITELSENQTTYRSVNKAFQKLKNQVKSEDLVVFYFSGRGSRVADNVFIDSETDKLDECLLLYDTILENGTPVSNHIRDDEIGKLLRRLNAKQSVVIIDACYQGNNAEEKGVTASSTASSSTTYDGMSEDFLPAGTVVLEACAPDETTLDGAFTSLLTELAKAGNDSDGITTIEEFHAHAKNKLKLQEPQLVDLESRAAQVSLVHPLLEVISQPIGATIFVNDKERGATPKSLILPIGLHKIKVRKRGYHLWDNAESSIEIRQPGIQRLPIDIITLTPVQMTGEVKFRNSNRPVEGATVKIMGARNIPQTKTDKQGRFVFNDWSQNDLSEDDEYEIGILDEGGRCQTESLTLKVPSDFTRDIPLGTIPVDRRITVTVTVTNALRKIKMPNAVVQLNQQQILDENLDGVFETPIINPLNSVALRVYQMGYETTDGDEVYKETITIAPETHKYPKPVQLKPALHTYSVKVTNQFREPVPSVTIILNGEQLGNVTTSDGIAEGQRHLAPDEPMSLQLKKNGYELFNRSIQPERLERRAFHQYRIPIQLDVIRISLLAVDESDIPVKGVQINADNRPTATTDAEGKATVSIYRPPNKEISLDIVYESKEHQIRKTTILQALKDGLFKILAPGLAEAIGATGLKIYLPIPPEIRLSMTVQEQDKEPLPKMMVMVNGKAYGETTSTGKSKIHGRIAIVENAPPKLEFNKYGETYKPQKTNFESTGTNAYTALVTLQIPYGKIEIAANTKVMKVTEQEISLYVDAEVELDEETQIHRLPATIPVFPGTHQLRILMGGTILYRGLLKIARNETKPIHLTLPVHEAWRACLLTLQKMPNDVQVLQSAEEIANALKREDLASTLHQRRK